MTSRRKFPSLAAALVAVGGVLGLVCALGCGGTNPPANEPVAPSEPSEGTRQDDGALEQAEDAIRASDFERVKTVCTQLVQREPNNAKAHYYLAVASENLGDKPQALSHYREALRVDASLAEAALNLSALLIDDSAFDEAVKVLDEAAKRNPQDAALRVNLGYARLGMNDLNGAEKAFDDALGISDAADARLGMAELWLVQSKPERAMPHIGKAVELAPTQVQVLVTAAELYRKSHAGAECVAAYDKAIEQKPIAQLYANRGVCKQINKDSAGAKADYQKAIEVDPNYGPAYYLFGRYLLSVEKNKKAAIEQFEHCAKVAPDSQCKQAAEQAKTAKP